MCVGGGIRLRCVALALCFEAAHNQCIMPKVQFPDSFVACVTVV